MNVNTDSFRALADRVDGLEAEVARLRSAVRVGQRIADGALRDAYDDGRESVLGSHAGPRPPRARHLRAVDGGQR